MEIEIHVKDAAEVINKMKALDKTLVLGILDSWMIALFDEDISLECFNK